MHEFSQCTSILHVNLPFIIMLLTLLCRDVKGMAKDVMAEVAQIFQREEHISATEAQTKVSSLVQQRRYIMDIWQ